MGAMQRLWDSEKLYLTGDEYFADMLAGVSSSQKCIEVETYIYEPGVLADRMADALVEAANRGVRVRMIVDVWGSPDFHHKYGKRLSDAGIGIKLFRQGPFWKGLRRINRGLHRKFTLIDDKTLWVGSFNVADVHLEEVYQHQAWKDVGARVEGPDVVYAKRSFDRTYSRWKKWRWPRRRSPIILINDSYLNQRHVRRYPIKLMRRAKCRIWISTPYFVPVGLILRTLVKRARSGIDVRIILPEQNDIWFMRWLSLPLLERLNKNGVKVFMYQPRFSHQKVLVVDDWMIIGSTNMNHRSFLHDLEMDILITHEENKKLLFNSLLIDQDRSLIFDTPTLFRLSWWQGWLSRVFSWLRYWS